MLTVVLALIGIAARVYSEMNKGHAEKAYMNDTKNAIQSQVDTVRGQILLCGLLYPSGNNATAFNVKYPGGNAVNVSTLACPGNPASNKSIWTGNDGTFLPVVPGGFSGWLYTNDATGIRVAITSDGGVLANNVLANVAAKFSPAEATYSMNTLTVWIVKS